MPPPEIETKTSAQDGSHDENLIEIPQNLIAFINWGFPSSASDFNWKQTLDSIRIPPN